MHALIELYMKSDVCRWPQIHDADANFLSVPSFLFLCGAVTSDSVAKVQGGRRAGKAQADAPRNTTHLPASFGWPAPCSSAVPPHLTAQLKFKEEEDQRHPKP